MPAEEKKKKAKKATKATKSTDQQPPTSASEKSTACYGCHKTHEETPSLVMLTCKTCGLKIHAKCYENQHFSVKYADSWECVECKKCEVCKDSEYKEGNEILMCNRCDKGYHQLCCSEKFRTVPEGDKPWFCESCHDYLKEKKQKKKRKVEKNVTKSESSESLFKLKPNKLQKLEESKHVAPTNGTTNTTTATPTPQPTTSNGTTSTTSTTATTPNGTNNKDVKKEASKANNSNNIKDQGAQTDTLKDRISVFLIYSSGGDGVFYSCNCPVPLLLMEGVPTEKRSTLSSIYFKDLKSIVLKRLNAKIQDLKEDESTDVDILKMLNENTPILKRFSLKDKDRFNSDLKVELDRLYFEDYSLSNGDTLFIDFSFAPTTSI